MADAETRSEIERQIIEALGPDSRLLEPAALLAEVTRLQDYAIDLQQQLMKSQDHRLRLMHVIIEAGLPLPPSEVT